MSYQKVYLEAQTDLIEAALVRAGASGLVNGELAKIALKYTSRISDLRKRGKTVTAIRETVGTWRYRLEE
jgi:hypothetical protein